MDTEKLFEKIIRNSQQTNFTSKIKDEISLKSVFEYMVKIIGIMSSYFVSINDITGYNSLFESFESQNTDDETNKIHDVITSIQSCGSKVKEITDMIYEYLNEGTVTNGYIEKHMVASNIVNRNTHQAQAAVNDYDGQMSIEIPCQVYDVTIDIFNSSISVMNEQRNLSVLYAEQSNLAAIARKNQVIH